MNEIEAVTYAESREAFFAGVLRKAERQLDWAVKHNPDCYVCAEKGEAVSFYRDALAAIREQAEREKGCNYCLQTWPDRAAAGVSDIWHGNKLSVGYGVYREIKFCPMCGKRLEVEP